MIHIVPPTRGYLQPFAGRVEANGYDAVRVGVEVSMPRSATLEQVAVYRGDRVGQASRTAR